MGRGKTLINDLTVTKKTDKSSPMLKVAWATGRNLGEGVLTIEEVSESGGLLHSVIFKLKSILVDSVTTANGFPYHVEEMIALNVESLKMMSS